MYNDWLQFIYIRGWLNSEWPVLSFNILDVYAQNKQQSAFEKEV